MIVSPARLAAGGSGAAAADNAGPGVGAGESIAACDAGGCDGVRGPSISATPPTGRSLRMTSGTCSPDVSARTFSRISAEASSMRSPGVGATLANARAKGLP